MRMFSLLRLAAEAESLRWRRAGRGYAIQAGLGVAAAMFGLMLLMMLHLAGFVALSRLQGPEVAALILAGVDLLLLALLGWLAVRRGADKVALEAQQVRDDALRQVGDTAARGFMLLPLLRSQTAKKGLIGAALAAAAVGLVSRR
jgi:hypothetical protein